MCVATICLIVHSFFGSSFFDILSSSSMFLSFRCLALSYFNYLVLATLYFLFLVFSHGLFISFFFYNVLTRFPKHELDVFMFCFLMIIYINVYMHIHIYICICKYTVDNLVQTTSAQVIFSRFAYFAHLVTKARLACFLVVSNALSPRTVTPKNAASFSRNALLRMDLRLAGLYPRVMFRK